MRIFDYSRFYREIQDILIAILALTFAFTISNFSHYGFRVSPQYAIYVVSVSLAAVCLAFLLHEIAHRQVARRYGGFAEFRVWPMGLLGGILFSFLGFVLAAPGAVYMSGIFGNERVGKTALAGPATNIVLGATFMAAGAALLSTFWGNVFGYLAQINLYLAVFNLVPFHPLDGQKVMAWDLRTFALAFITAIFLAILAFIIFPN